MALNNIEQKRSVRIHMIWDNWQYGWKLILDLCKLLDLHLGVLLHRNFCMFACPCADLFMCFRPEVVCRSSKEGDMPQPNGNAVQRLESN
eukprot:2445379-Amphidinium_carterae.1